MKLPEDESLDMEQASTNRQMTIAGVLIGVALAACFDGIVFHQILGWHHMVSHVLPPTTMSAMLINMLWDGLFNASAVLLGIIGLVLLFRAARRTQTLPARRRLGGLLLRGFGLFNLIEGIIDHHLLQIHHVREVANPLPWDLGFLVSMGLLPIGLGWLLLRQHQTLGQSRTEDVRINQQKSSEQRVR